MYIKKEKATHSLIHIICLLIIDTFIRGIIIIYRNILIKYAVIIQKFRKNYTSPTSKKSDSMCIKKDSINSSYYFFLVYSLDHYITKSPELNLFFSS